MDLVAFRVSMYKGIVDSGWVEVNPLTVLVGKNESGKTSLLKSLHKLNPYVPEPYDMAREWPRGRRRERDEEHIVCQAKFRLSAQEKSDLAQLTERANVPDTVEVSRNYRGQFKVNFGEDIFLDNLPNGVNNALESLPKVQDEFGDLFKQRAEACIKAAKRFAHEERFSELSELIQDHDLLLLEALTPSEPPQQLEVEFMNQYLAGLRQLVGSPAQLPSLQSKVHEYVIEHLPTFIYMSDYKIFRGTAQLDEIQSRKDTDQLTEEDKTFLTILNLSGLDLGELVWLGQADIETLKERQLDIADGAKTLTAKISDRLSQRRYQIEYRVDGQRFFTHVTDDHDSSLVSLEERSKGFQWFFSFDLMFMHESKETFEGCIVLLDEPGLHLHPEAQKDLLRRLEHYAEGNTLLYTTHLPFMIDLHHPNRIRVLKETGNGTAVTTDFTEDPPEARLVLQAALGMNASQSFLVAKRNLVVEGVNDYRILMELSNLLERVGKKGLPEDVRITPGGSASQAVHVATFMIGQKLGVVTLLDSDDAGRTAKNKLVETWLTQYQETQTKVILLGDAVGASGDFALEDLFPEEFITAIVQEAYDKELKLADVNEIELVGEGILWKRIERFMTKNEIEITKGPIATRLRKKLSNMKDASELPSETQERAIKLFQKIRDAFPEV